MNKLTICPSTLAKGYSTYSPIALKKLFDGKKVSQLLPFDPPQLNKEVAKKFRENRVHLSISGVQIKQSLIQEGKSLRLSNKEEGGSHILKPIPHGEVLDHLDDLPANENLCMQMAEQVYGISTAGNGLIFFQNGEAAYITKRFDRQGGRKLHQEDFAVLMGKSPQANGETFKYQGSYEEMAEQIQQNVPAAIIEMEKFFKLILFNYLICNGDAHLKNFSLQMTKDGDYILAPAYDLLNTRLHLPEDSAFALENGLFKNDFESKSFTDNGFYAYDDFYYFGKRIGILENRLLNILELFQQDHPLNRQLISNSYLSKEAKQIFTEHYESRLERMRYSFEF